MKELQSIATQRLKTHASPSHQTPETGCQANAGANDLIEVVWARHQDDVRQAQRLRYRVFAGEMGARLQTRIAGHDADMVEVGRSCVHPDHRQGRVILALWGALAGFMVDNRLDTMIGCASIPMQWQGAHGLIGGGHAAASIWHQLRQRHLASAAYHVRPRLPLPVEELDGNLDVQPPALIRAYLRLGAKLLGPPAWDPDFNTADLPMMLRIADLPARYRKHFLGD